ncbi:hypothetical protein OF83DRAFT_467435 [Amylostereum chailletii]|nr:hypothetical protein OF83DRAFT_467435 [Amylostereum chailletii]
MGKHGARAHAVDCTRQHASMERYTDKCMEYDWKSKGRRTPTRPQPAGPRARSLSPPANEDSFERRPRTLGFQKDSAFLRYRRARFARSRQVLHFSIALQGPKALPPAPSRRERKQAPAGPNLAILGRRIFPHLCRDCPGARGGSFASVQRNTDGGACVDIGSWAAVLLPTPHPSCVDFPRSISEGTSGRVYRDRDLSSLGSSVPWDASSAGSAEGNSTGCSRWVGACRGSW